jgi:hypothetical protein
MNQGHKISMTVVSKSGSGNRRKVEKITFCFIFYRIKHGDFFLGKEFYEKWGRLPENRHNEVEILDIDFSKSENSVIFHYHRGKNNKLFVCYPLPMPGIEDVKKMLKIWCIGTAFSMRYGLDFQTIYKAGQHEQFFDILKTEYGLTI